MPAARKRELTTPDLVLLSLLAERPMHGYQANQELLRREVQDWAGISRPQVYYSLEKLARRGLIRAGESDEPAAGPERSVFATTTKGRAALADALERDEWATQRERPPFLTWVALSWQARPGVFARQVRRREKFL
jgi:DNA-binding PadR family transcriptional regulator